MEPYLVDCTDATFGFYLGQRTLMVHDRELCLYEFCSIHNPSDHNMRDFPQLWRADRVLMERICPHGNGHPDFDHLEHTRRTRGDKAANTESIHNCDGCCRNSETIADPK